MNSLKRCGARLLIALTILIGLGHDLASRQIRNPQQTVKTKPNIAVQTNCNDPAVPDIVLHRIQVAGGPDGKFAPGQTYSIVAVLENRGQCETAAFRVRISVYAQDMTANKVEDRVILDRLVQSIQPTRDKAPAYTLVTASFTLGPNYSSTYDFMAYADPDNRVREFIENNNALERGYGFTIDVGPRIK